MQYNSSPRRLRKTSHLISVYGVQNVWRRYRYRVLWAGGLALAFVSLGGFLGLYQYRLEILSHFRLQYVACALIGLVIAWLNQARAVAALAGACLLINLWFVAPGLVRSTPLLARNQAVSTEASGRLRLLHANILMSNREYQRFARLVREARPDVWFVQEVDQKWLDYLRREFAQDYPHTIGEASDGRFGIAAFSSRPFDAARVLRTGPKSDRRGPSLEISLRVNDRAVRLYSSHPPPPLDAAKARTRNLQILELLVIADRDPSPYVLIGDLNNTKYSPWFTKWLRASRLSPPQDGGLHFTWPVRLPAMGIEIDHCLVTGGLNLVARVRGPDVGSDHFPVICDIIVEDLAMK
ncbi:MAG: endonuclease/exonuclease/phosphatase family protein [Leptospirales bacterium]|jgi:endonuclease/exonuclease/phosphatase (EEP) superfamily protein YafD